MIYVFPSRTGYYESLLRTISADGQSFTDKVTVRSFTEVYATKYSKQKGQRYKGWTPALPYGRGMAVLNPVVGTFSRYFDDGTSIQMNGPTFNSAVHRTACRNVGTSLGISSTIRLVNAENRAATEVLGKLTQSNFNLGVAIAEGKQTLSFISQTVVLVMRVIQAIRAKKWQQVLNLLAISKHKFRAPSKDVGSRWLEIQYALLPLLSDIYGAYEFFTKISFPKDKPLRVSRTVTFPDEYELKQSDGSVIKMRDTVSVRYIVWYTITDSRLAFATALGLTNPALIVWEKVPYSFVVDWLFPVGNLLSAFTSTLGLSFKGGCVTKRVTSKMSREVLVPPYEGRGVQEGNISVYTRTNLTRFPTPRPYVKSPFSTRHTISALALLNQRR